MVERNNFNSLLLPGEGLQKGISTRSSRKHDFTSHYKKLRTFSLWESIKYDITQILKNFVEQNQEKMFDKFYNRKKENKS